MFWTVLGAAAAVLTMFSFVPQIIKSLRTKSVKDVSHLTLIQLACGASLWVFYGIHLKNPVIIVANIVTLATVIILMALYFKYGGIACRKEVR